jgi:hypothetical protein
VGVPSGTLKPGSIAGKRFRENLVVLYPGISGKLSTRRNGTTKGKEHGPATRGASRGALMSDGTASGPPVRAANKNKPTF